MKWDEVVAPADLPQTVDEISYQRVVMNAGAIWDYVPWHFDPGYAQSHGHRSIFVNTMHLTGFVDRIAVEWAGPYSRVVRRKVTLLGSIYAGDAMVGRGRGVGKRVEDSRQLVDLEIAIYNQHDELCCPAEVTLELTAR